MRRGQTLLILLVLVLHAGCVDTYIPPTPTPTPPPTPTPTPTPTEIPDPPPLGEPLEYYIDLYGQPFDTYDPPGEVSMVAGFHVGDVNVWIQFEDGTATHVEIR